jgi:hypothetical protein
VFPCISSIDKEAFDFTRGHLNPSVKLHALHESVVPAGVTVLLGLCNPPRRGRGEPVKHLVRYRGREADRQHSR